jgi:DNA helicase-2/ATP-dependent DNA helicase PcrA
MEVIADLHLHSKYSRAVSQNMTLPTIVEWAAKKGIGLVSTADWTHPIWLREIKSRLTEAGEGVYKLKNVKSQM